MGIVRAHSAEAAEFCLGEGRGCGSVEFSSGVHTRPSWLCATIGSYFSYLGWRCPRMELRIPHARVIQWAFYKQPSAVPFPRPGASLLPAGHLN